MEVIEIPFGAKDSELQGWTYTIPDGMEAEIKDGQVIIKKKKSKDEQIREALISYLKDMENCGGVVSFNGFSIKEYVTYLEKQKPSEWSEEDEENLNTVLDMVKYCSVVPPENIPSSTGHLYPTEKYKKELTNWLKSLRNRGNFPKSNTNSPSEWSEADENKLNHILEIVHIASGREASVDEKEELESFLKSLRPQPKQEWSKEEQTIIEGACNALEIHGHSKLADKLKSLRSHLHWKPSEEQMAELNKVRTLNPGLDALYQQLKNM